MGILYVNSTSVKMSTKASGQETVGEMAQVFKVHTALP